MGLSDRDRAILDFERSWWTEPGTKSTAIRNQLQLSPARYYELLGALATSSDAAGYDPLLVRRLRRLRANRRRARIEGRSAVLPRGR
ncbi:MAG: DUF3263 domain-containing protein [Actinobacteria bacterium]|nr:DUF3263 domain-containing protein [Actinomycetota bacterium]